MPTQADFQFILLTKEWKLKQRKVVLHLSSTFSLKKERETYKT
jgi:hypothetical protein